MSICTWQLEGKTINNNAKYSLKHNNQKIEYVLQKGDIVKLGRIKFAVKEISIVGEEGMDVDEGEMIKHANVEMINEEEYFEFADVESLYNPIVEEGSQQTSSEEVQ